MSLSISDNHLKLSGYVPAEFVRKPRSLSDLGHWKATEFRLFLLYTGPVVLSSVLRFELYDNFLTLHVALRLLCSRDPSTDIIEYAKSLLQHFVFSFGSLYGKEYISHNIHGLLHLADDASNFGRLDNFSAFKFENYMKVLKGFLRKADKPLQQVIRRYFERERFSKEKHPENISYPVPLCPINKREFEKVKFKDFVIHAGRKKDNCCLLKTGEIVIIESIFSEENKYVVSGRKFKKYENLYEKPCLSKVLQIFVVSGLSSLKIWSLSDISIKMVLFPIRNAYAAFPLLHCEM